MRTESPVEALRVEQPPIGKVRPSQRVGDTRLRFYAFVCHLVGIRDLIAINAHPKPFDNRKLIHDDSK